MFLCLIIFAFSPSRSSWSDNDILHPSSTNKSNWGWSQHKRPSLYASVVLGISHRHFDVCNFSSNIKIGPSEKKCGAWSGSKIIYHLHHTQKSNHSIFFFFTSLYIVIYSVDPSFALFFKYFIGDLIYSQGITITFLSSPEDTFTDEREREKH